MPDTSLMPVIVGGVLAIAGGATSSVILHVMRTKAEKRNKRSEKFEEMVAAVYEHSHWLEQARNIRVFGSEGAITLSP